jgi:hypothetical protein
MQTSFNLVAGFGRTPLTYTLRLAARCSCPNRSAGPLDFGAQRATFNP